MMELSSPFCPTFTFVSLYSLLFLFSIVKLFLNLQYVCQSVVQPVLFAIHLASSLSIIPFFQFLINPRGFNSFYSHFLKWCMLISNWNKQFHKCVKCSIWLLQITQHRPTNSIYNNNIGITTKPLVWPLILYTILDPAFGTLVFLDRATILWSLHPMDLDTAFKQISAALVKMWSIHVDDFIHVLFVTTL